jgi:SAM-dependent methyltransferase
MKGMPRIPTLFRFARAALKPMAYHQIRWALISHANATAKRCPICGYFGFFRGFGDPLRTAAQCPRCGSLERHRLLALAVQRGNVRVAGRDIIHVAAEPSLSAVFKQAAPRTYRISQYPDSGAELNLNLENLSLADDSLDVMIANHVLEHVDDRRALAEIHRVLKPGGDFICMVPIVEGWKTTYENHAITLPRDRAAHFGQYDHVRFYAADFRDRLARAGFSLREIDATPADVIAFGLLRGEKVFVATK